MVGGCAGSSLESYDILLLGYIPVHNSTKFLPCFAHSGKMATLPEAGHSAVTPHQDSAITLNPG